MSKTAPRILRGKRDADSAYPFDRWLKTVKDAKTRARILQRIGRMERGNFGDSKEVGMGVSELRLDFGPGYRVYFAKHRSMLIVLLAGGDKSSQTADINKARELWRDLLKSGIDEADLPLWQDETA